MVGAQGLDKYGRHQLGSHHKYDELVDRIFVTSTWHAQSCFSHIVHFSLDHKVFLCPPSSSHSWELVFIVLVAPERKTAITETPNASYALSLNGPL